jgi:hypothetical protein
MAKYTVNFSCGHTQVVELFGKNTERERKISYFERSGTCSDCYRAQQDTKRQAELSVYNSANLPALTGTPKQIDWANKIRCEKYQMFANRGFERIANESAAAWWIDHRNDVESEIYTRSQATRKADLAKKVLSLTKSDIFNRAHALAKQLKTQYPDTNYRANFAESLRALYAAVKIAKMSA